MAEEQTKIKQVRSQLKTSEYDSQHAGEAADALHNLPVFWSFWEDPGEPEPVQASISTVYHFHSCIWHKTCHGVWWWKRTQNQIERSLDDPFTMIKNSWCCWKWWKEARPTQKYSTASVAPQASCLNCKEAWWTSLDLWVRLKDGFLNPSAILPLKIF